MTTTDQVLLVHNRHGVILGVDWRRVPGMTAPEFVVPGAIPARAVQPGDRIAVDGSTVTAMSVVPGRVDGLVHIVTRTEAGAEIAIERGRDDLVTVVGFEDFS